MRIRLSVVKPIRIRRISIIADMGKRSASEVDLLPVQANIKRLIKATGLTVNGWAVKHEMTQSTIARITGGKLDPTTGQVAAIAGKLGVQAWQLLDPDLGAKLYVIEDSRVIPLFNAARAPPALGGNSLRRTEAQKISRSDEDRRKNPDRRGPSKNAPDS